MIPKHKHHDRLESIHNHTIDSSMAFSWYVWSPYSIKYIWIFDYSKSSKSMQLQKLSFMNFCQAALMKTR
jgi:hypothetical protein